MTTAATDHGAPTACTICREPAHGTDTHPCCTWWNERAPGLPCPACAASRAAERERGRRRRGRTDNEGEGY